MILIRRAGFPYAGRVDLRPGRDHMDCAPMNIKIGVSEDSGFRERMEDEYAVHDRPDLALLSAEVYDGHLGREAAHLAAEMLTPHFINRRYEEQEKPASERLDDALILRESYTEVDRFISFRGIRGGAAAATLHILRESFMAANTGDSRVVIGVRNGARTLTLDHKPDVAEERARIESLGGMITWAGVPRVMGFLAMSRALGDTELKPYVTPEPRIVSGLLGRENDYAILACDGVWDVLTPETTIRLARRAKEAQGAAEAIKNKALEEGSTDNITVLVLDLRAHTKTLSREAMETLAILDMALSPEPGEERARD
jgi:protein phosphatase 1L